MKTATAPLPPLRSVRFWTSCVSAYAACITAYQPNRLMSTGFVPSSVSTVCVARQPWAAAKSRHFCPGWRIGRKVSVSTHRQALAALLFFYGKVLCRICPGFRRSEDLRPSRRLPVVLTPDEVVRILGFWKASIVCSPSFCMEQAWIGEVCNCGSRIWFRSRHDHRAGGKELKDRALMLPELGTQPARAAVACTGMVAEGPGRGPQRRCASRRP